MIIQLKLLFLLLCHYKYYYSTSEFECIY